METDSGGGNDMDGEMAMISIMLVIKSKITGNNNG